MRLSEPGLPLHLPQCRGKTTSPEVSSTPRGYTSRNCDEAMETPNFV